MAAAGEITAEAIWARTSHYNDLDITIQNPSSEPVSSPMQIIVEDVETEKKEISKSFILTAKPLETATFEFQIKDLPYSGVKRVIGIVEDETIQIEPTGKILVEESRKIFG